MLFPRSIAAFVASLSLVAGQSTQVLNLLTRPDIVAPWLDVTVSNESLITPGYIFFTPNSPGQTNFQYGPYIYNNHGHLVFSGYKLLSEGYGAFDPQIVRHRGEDMLAFTQFAGPRGGGPADGGSYSELFDHNYTSRVRIHPVGSINGQGLTHDLHEFNVIGDEGERALITSYMVLDRNITFHNCPGKPVVRWLKDGGFAEISTDGSNANLFQMSFIDLIDPAESYVCPGQHLVGSGNMSYDGFDYLHINSIDKDDAGDYLVSCRHMNTVYKIAGISNPEGYAPGTIVWRLGGRSNDFPIMDSEVPTSPNLNFSFQHHARWAPEIEGITLWNNGNNAIINASAVSSSGMDIRVGNGRATLIGQWISPGGELDSSQGSHQTLDSGNHFLGLGSYPAIYELTPDGQTAFYANWGPLPLQSYRSFKFNWTGYPPLSEIGYFAFSKECDGTAAFYASWNGATEIDSWHFYTSSDNETFYEVAWKYAGNTFETMVTAPFNLYSFAEAFESNGRSLGRTPIKVTWTAPENISGDCELWGCPSGTDYFGLAGRECEAPSPTDSIPDPVDPDTPHEATIVPGPINESPEEAAASTPDEISDAIAGQNPQNFWGNGATTMVRVAKSAVATPAPEASFGRRSIPRSDRVVF